jgi:hypothetical protein
MGRKLRRSRAKGKKADFIIANIKAQRGIDRAEHFAKGGDLVQYWGGPKTVTRNRKRDASRNACRVTVKDY